MRLPSAAGMLKGVSEASAEGPGAVGDMVPAEWAPRELLGAAAAVREHLVRNEAGREMDWGAYLRGCVDVADRISGAVLEGRAECCGEDEDSLLRPHATQRFRWYAVDGELDGL